MGLAESSAEIAARVFREASGRVLATLIRQTRDFELAEDALQDALTRALEVWPERGVPDNPVAWIVVTARNKAIDRLRRATSFADKQETLRSLVELSRQAEETEDEPDIEDDRLRLIFTACHPALAMDARVALTLRTLGGLTTREIARAFLVAETTMAQRLVRAKRKIRLAGIPYRVPAPDQLPERLEGVQSVLYLIFNEGYAASEGRELIRQELCAEAIRLAKLLAALLPDAPEVLGLTALMLLHDSRRRARVSPSGQLVVLEEQDRNLWDEGQIEEGLRYLDGAMRRRDPGPYQIQAAVSATHAQAARAEETDWKQIAFLYQALFRMTGSPVVALNHAVAVGMADGADQGLLMLEAIARGGQLEDYHLLYSARADLLRRAGRLDEALPVYERAIELSRNERERDYLIRRREEVRRGLAPEAGGAQKSF